MIEPLEHTALTPGMHTETNVQFALAQGGTLVLPPPKEQTNG